MRLEDMTVALRPRLPWEAVDLGCAMVRRDFARISALWAATVLPVWALICVLLWNSPGWAGFLIWWLKPLYDRVPLYFLSRVAFGSRPSVGACLKVWPKLWFTNFLGPLLWRRFSFIRSFAMPVYMLEGLRGSAVRKRVSTLAIDAWSSAAFTSYAFLKLETVLTLALVFTTADLLPEEWSIDWSAFFTAPEASGIDKPYIVWWGNACYMIAMSLMEPFYVGAGFGLYLNCRTRIEGWDVELAFRRLAARLKPAATAAVMLMLFMIGAPKAEAAEAARTPKAIAEEILAKEEFKVHTAKEWEFVPDAHQRSRGKTDFSFMETIGQVLFWMVVAAAVIWLGWYLYRNQHLFRFHLNKSAPPPEPPKVVMGMNITRESLPDDIVAAALAAWDAGQGREALSLLYRGALSWLVTQRRVPIRDSDTEEDCLAQVTLKAPQEESRFFQGLTGAWVQTAYATLPLRREDVVALCKAWPFAGKGGAA
jgi:hypothetical protein